MPAAVHATTVWPSSCFGRIPSLPSACSIPCHASRLDVANRLDMCRSCSTEATPSSQRGGPAARGRSLGFGGRAPRRRT